jgi:hypothetical protein
MTLSPGFDPLPLRRRLRLPHWSLPWHRRNRTALPVPLPLPTACRDSCDLPLGLPRTGRRNESPTERRRIAASLAPRPTGGGGKTGSRRGKGQGHRAASGRGEDRRRSRGRGTAGGGRWPGGGAEAEEEQEAEEGDMAPWESVTEREMGLAPPPQTSQRGYDVNWDSAPRIGASPSPCNPLSTSQSARPLPWAPAPAPARRDRDVDLLEECGWWQPTLEDARAKAEEEEKKDSGHDDKDRDAAVGSRLESCAADNWDSGSDDLIRSLAAAPAEPSSVAPAVSASAAISAFGSGSGSCLEFEGSREEETPIAPAVEHLSPSRWSSSFLLSARSSIAIAAASTTPTPTPNPPDTYHHNLNDSPLLSPPQQSGYPLPRIKITAADHGHRPERPEVKMRGPSPQNSDGQAFDKSSRGHDDRSFQSTRLDDSSTIATSVFHIEGARTRHAPSVASTRRLFTTLLPPTPFSDRPSSSQSHLTGLRAYNDHDNRSLSADDPWAEGQGRISSESAMTVLQRDSAYRGRMDGRQDSDADSDAHSGPVDPTASMTRREFEALPPAIQRKVRESALIDICSFLLLLPLRPDLHTAGPMHSRQTPRTITITPVVSWHSSQAADLHSLSPSRPGSSCFLGGRAPAVPRSPRLW